VNDDELRQALGTALAAPAVTAAPDAGARLRARARRARTGRLAVSGTLVAVLAVLLTVGVVRGLGGSAPPAPAAGPAATGLSRLTTPLTVALTQRVSPSAGPCDAGPGLRCVPPAVVLDVDEVEGLATAELPESGAVVLATLTATDAGTLAGAAPPGSGPLLAAIAGAPYPAEMTAGRVLRIYVPTPRVASEVVGALGPVAVPPARVGPGPLDVPLQIWTVTAATPSPCAVSSVDPGVRVVDRSSECLVLTGPALSIGTADLELVPPQGDGGGWQVWVELDPPATAQLGRYTGTHVGGRIAFVAGKRMIGAGPTIQGRFSSSLEIPVPDRASAESLISRLRR
jgi:hypothetical protein